MVDNDEHYLLPERYREVAFQGRSCAITLRTTIDGEDLEFLLNHAFSLVCRYEDEGLKQDFQKKLKEVEK